MANLIICPAAVEYRPLRHRQAEDSSFFQQFLAWQKSADALTKSADQSRYHDLVVQVVRHPQMASTHPLRTVRWFRGGGLKPDGAGLASLSSDADVSSLTDKIGGLSTADDATPKAQLSAPPPASFVEVDSGHGFQKANSFMNVMCRCSSCGTGKGWFFELNMYVAPGTKPSAHHTSSVHGVLHARDTSDDGPLEATKGAHWVFGEPFDKR